MIDIIEAQKCFQEYVSNYDKENTKIKLKIIHTFKVAENSRMIAKGIGLSEEEQDLAELIGILHDIGRFEQFRLYETYADKTSVDHASKGLEVLFGDKLIRKFVKEDKYDTIIYKAIGNHNKLNIGKGLSEKELLFTKIIRDADNLDIYRGLLEQKIEDFGHIGTDDIRKEKLSPEFFEDFKKETLLIYANAKTDMDVIVAIIAHLYALNFETSLKIIKEQNYINRFVKRLDAKDPYTKEKMDEIAKISMDYINKKIG